MCFDYCNSNRRTGRRPKGIHGHESSTLWIGTILDSVDRISPRWVGRSSADVEAHGWRGAIGAGWDEGENRGHRRCRWWFSENDVGPELTLGAEYVTQNPLGDPERRPCRRPRGAAQRLPQGHVRQHPRLGVTAVLEGRQPDP